MITRMKWLFAPAALAAWFLLFATCPARAQEDQYVRIYMLIHDADALAAPAQAPHALAIYRQAQSDLRQFQKTYPNWNSSVVDFRLAYLASRIKVLSTNTPPARPRPSPASPSDAAGGRLNGPERAQLENRLNNLANQVQHLQSDKQLLQDKLKEALAARPADADPRELARAEQRIAALEKENALLQVTAAARQTNSAPATGAEAVDRLKHELADANRRLAKETELDSRMTKERDRLQVRVNALLADGQTLASLRAENQVLKRQVADLKQSPTPGPPRADLARSLAEARAKIAALQSEQRVWNLERTALEDRIKRLSAPPPATVSTSAPPARDNARLKELHRERVDLQRKLDAARKALYGRNRKSVETRIEDLTGQMETLRARLAVFDPPQAPYTRAELALFRKGEIAPATADPAPHQPSIRSLPAGTAALVAEARRDVAAKRFNEAEQKYLQVLQKDQNNVYALASLATIQLELGRLDDAEQHIRRALSASPNDARSLLVQGEIRFQQQQYDRALDAFNRAAKLDPHNAGIQNYLGLILSQQGRRGSAEQAFLKATQLDPKCASAQYNLAVFYILQKPPWPELARWHYRKALDTGFTRNRDLEKRLDYAAADEARH